MEEREKERREQIIKERIVPEGEKLIDSIPWESEKRGFLTQIRVQGKQIKTLEKNIEKLSEELEKEKRRSEEFENLYYDLLKRHEMSSSDRELELEKKLSRQKKELTAHQKKCGNYRKELDKNRIQLEQKNKQLLEARTRADMAENCRRIEGLANYQKIKDYEEVIQSAQNSAV